MLSIMSRNLKIIIGSSIPSGILAGILYSILLGPAAGITGGLFTGLSIGATLFLILEFFHKRSVSKITGNNTDKALGNCHIRDVKLRTGFDEAYNLCLSSLDIVKGCSILKADRTASKITGRTGINWKTWGDIITFDLSRDDNGYTRIKVSSSPANRTTLVDFGKNLDNVQRITSFLEKYGGKH